MPISSSYHPAPVFARLGPQFHDAVEAARFPEHTLRFRNQRWARRVGLHELTDAEWERAFARFEPLPDNLPRPLALRYHGHQFRHYNPALGDGRGFLHAQVRDDDGRLLDLATKGSGQTMWSRGGDGRLTLKGGVREILATEMLEALGVYTSKSLSLFETGESLIRGDEPSPTRSSVLVRLGHSHVRFGSFQRHAYHDDVPSLRELLRFSLENYAPELCHMDTDRAAAPAFLELVTRRSAELCASWMLAGFVHGVLNTDNMNVTGESFDYGPFRFLPTLDPGFTAAYFDHTGLYAYGQQPDAVRWNLVQLARALAPLAAERDLETAVRRFDTHHASALDRATLRRLGLRSRGALRDRLLRLTAFELLEVSRMPFERFFFDWFGGSMAETRALRGPAVASYRSPAGVRFREHLAGHRPAASARLDHPYFERDEPCTMLIDEVESIWSAIDERDDWSVLEAKVADIREMASALEVTS